MPAPARASKPPIGTLALEERVRRRAYELYILRGNESGSELDDWLQAEEEIRNAAEASRRRLTFSPPSLTAQRVRVADCACLPESSSMDGEDQNADSGTEPIE